MSLKQVPLWRWAVLVLPVFAAPILIFWIQSNEDLEENMRGIRTILAMGLCALLTWLWLMVMITPGWKPRVVVFLIPFFMVGCFLSLLRQDGSDGNGQPHWAWRWAPQKDETLEKITPQGKSDKLKTPEGSADFLRFLGNKGDNRVEGVILARDWKAQPPKEIWRHEVGAGWTGFVVKGALAITQEQRGPDELVVAYNLSDGKPVWIYSKSIRFSEGQGGDGPRATPTIFNDRVYTMGATGWLSCLDFSTGSLIWETDVLANPKAENLRWGKSCSPLVFGDKVIVTGGEKSSAAILAYEARTGKPLWQSGLPGDGSSYTTVVATKLGGRDVLLCVNASSLTIHDPATGTILANHPWEGIWPKCSDPIALPGDRILLTAGYQMGDYLLQAKADGEKFSLEVLWNTRTMKTTFNNCTIRDNAAYGIDDGMLACIDLKDGKRLWKSERVGHGQVLAVGDLLLVQTEPGPVLLVEASPAGSKVLGRLKALEGKTWNNLCLAGKFLLCRNDREAACFELPVGNLEPRK